MTHLCYNWCSYVFKVDSWPCVTFFTPRKKKGLWALNEIKHTVSKDVKCKLQSPDIVLCGSSRLLYNIKGKCLAFIYILIRA